MEETLGIMFHHFHNDVHLRSQGSIDTNAFVNILDYLESKYKILNADIYIEKFLNKSLRKGEICLTFDDALLCQYEIAIPVLRKRNITAFFFVYSSAFTDNPDSLEIYRYFRHKEYKDLNSFYYDFFSLIKQKYINNYQSEKETFKEIKYLTEFEFYTENDRWFRYLRDIVLTKNKYDDVMKEMMLKLSFDTRKKSLLLWMNEKDLQALSHMGHIIGLHSYNHPTAIHKLSDEEQLEEYLSNYNHLKSIISQNNLISMSHPCGNYNSATLKILREIGIKIGFRSNMSTKKIISPLEIPREDHVNILKEIKNI
tara:strand:+ start:8692 stop:9627 length:936 start_codon:yes stop_codon:yes gene_type:complete